MVVAQWLVALQWELLIMVVALQWLLYNGLHGSCSMVVAQWSVALQWELLIMVAALQWLLYNGLLDNGLLYNEWELLNDGCSAL